MQEMQRQVCYIMDGMKARQQKWANKQTGLSPNFWARAMGWYGMAMVDVLDYFPVESSRKRFDYRNSESVCKSSYKSTGCKNRIMV